MQTPGQRALEKEIGTDKQIDGEKEEQWEKKEKREEREGRRWWRMKINCVSYTHAHLMIPDNDNRLEDLWVQCN